jgi:dolichol-phosphate mannosyltransferase
MTVTVIVPTRNESGNVAPLVARLNEALKGRPAELIFVDDSDDDTAGAISESARRSKIVVRCLHREPGARAGGLGGAVVAGMKGAVGHITVVMDGDLQHPPECIPKLVAEIERTGSDIVVASRYIDGGNPDGLDGRVRLTTSRAGAGLARLLFPVRLRPLTDPMSGFFAVRMDAIRPHDLRPIGFKILLEIIVRSGSPEVSEVGFPFSERATGRSKAGVREGARFLAHLGRLRVSAVSNDYFTRAPAG